MKLALLSLYIYCTILAEMLGNPLSISKACKYHQLLFPHNCNPAAHNSIALLSFPILYLRASCAIDKPTGTIDGILVAYKCLWKGKYHEPQRQFLTFSLKMHTPAVPRSNETSPPSEIHTKKEI